MTAATSKHRRLAATAHHEAGHAVMSFERRQRFEYVTIEPSAGSLGHVEFRSLSRRVAERIELGHLTDRQLDTRVMINLAGVAAEAGVTGRNNWSGAHGDWDSAVDLVTRHVGSAEEAGAYMELLRIRTQQALRHPLVWLKVKAVATALLQRTRLSYRDARQVVAEVEAERMANDIARAKELAAKTTVVFR